MQRTAQIDFAFNINDFARSHARQASDPAGFAERQLAEFKHGQTVDLPDDGAVRINQNGTALDLFGHSFLNTVGTFDFGYNGLINMAARNDGRFAVRHGAVVGFADQVADGSDVRRQFLTVFRQAGSVFDQAGDGVFLQRAQFVAPSLRGNQAGIFRYVFLRFSI